MKPDDAWEGSALKILTSDPFVGVHKVNDDVINALK